jgi:hypothetical protein
MSAQPKLHVTRLRRPVSGAIFRVSSEQSELLSTKRRAHEQTVSGQEANETLEELKWQ